MSTTGKKPEKGIKDYVIHKTPIAILDFETTGLTPGIDRVVEISVYKLDPRKSLQLTFDTLVNPLRPMAATEIHGITDKNVAKAPKFSDIAGDLACFPDRRQAQSIPG